MIRDPLDVRRNNILRATAARAGQSTRSKAGTNGVGASDMNLSTPQRVPNFGDPNRDLEDHAWASLSGASGRRGAANGGILNGVQDRVSNFFDGDSLPMYKDKPYGYTPARRSRSLWRRKRVLGTLALAVLAVLYFTGFLTRGEAKRGPTAPGWRWLGTSGEKSKADWNKRRQRVVEAFELSWDSYERYAWGMLWRSPWYPAA